MFSSKTARSLKLSLVAWHFLSFAVGCGDSPPHQTGDRYSGASTSGSSPKDSKSTNQKLAGIGKPSDGSTPNSTAPNPSENDSGKQLVIYFGGFLGCTNMFAEDATPIDSKIDILQKSTNIHTTTSHHREQILYMTCYTPDPDSIRVVEGRSPTKPYKTTIAEFAKQIEALRTSTDVATIAVIGHSYGGWSAIKFVSLLSDKWNFSGLITIDPISRVNCAPNDFINHVLNSPTKGCIESPKDFDSQTLQRIAAGTKKWQNFYQTQDPVLRASSIDVAENIVVKVDGDAGKAHTGILQMDELLAGVRALVSR